jgi:hypothetical protein
MDRFKLESLNDSLVFNWEMYAATIRYLRPISEVCRLSCQNWEAHEKRNYFILFYFTKFVR